MCKPSGSGAMPDQATRDLAELERLRAKLNDEPERTVWDRLRDIYQQRGLHDGEVAARLEALRGMPGVEMESLRDRFAIAVLPVALKWELDAPQAAANQAHAFELAAEVAYLMADAMLLERARGGSS